MAGANVAARVRALRQAIDEATNEAVRVANKQRSMPNLRRVLPQDPNAVIPPELLPRTGAAELPAPSGRIPVEDTIRRAGPVDPAKVDRIVATLRTSGPESLDVEDVLELARAGADADLVLAGPLPAEQVKAILRKVGNQGIDPLTPEEMAGLKRTTGLPESSVGLSEADEVVDDLEFSATPIETDATAPANNLSAKTVSRDKLSELAQRIRQATTEADAEPVQRLPKLLKEVEALSPESRQALLEHPTLAEGIESIAAKRDPAAREAAIENAKARLTRLAEMAQTSTPDRAKGQLRSAKNARDVAGVQRTAPAGKAAAQADTQAAKQLVGESLPEGDLNAMADAFDGLTPERKQEVLARIAPGSRRFFDRLLDTSAGEPAFSPNARASLSRGASPLEDAIIRLDAAKRSGDPKAYQDALLDVQKIPASPDEIADAKRLFAERQQAASSMRNAIIGTDPMYVEEQARLIEKSLAPAPRPGITPTARTPEVAPVDVGRADLPTAYDEARAVNQDRQEMLEKRAPQGGLPLAERQQIFGTDDTRELPLAFKGDDTLNPFESRAPGARLTDSSDAKAIEKAIALEAELKAAFDEMRGASGAADLARAQKRVYAAQKAIDQAWPARLVNKRTGAVKDAPAGMTSDSVPKGYVLERGRPARADSRLNAAGSQETFDNTLVAIVGGRPKADATMRRSNPDMSPAERAVQNADVARRLGEEDISDLLPSSPDDEVVELGQGGKRGRLGGAQQKSRVQAAMRTLYSDTNPLSLMRPDGTPVFASAEQAAEDLLSRNTLFKPGTASWDLARERLAKAIGESYGSQPGPRVVDEATMQPAAPAGSVAGDVRAGTAQDASRVPSIVARGSMGDPEGFDEAVSYGANRAGEKPAANATKDFSSPVNEGVLPESLEDDLLDSSREALDNSAVDISEPATGTDVGGESKPKGGRRRRGATAAEASGNPAPNAAPAAGTRPVTGADIQVEADEVFRETLRQAQDEGMSQAEAIRTANAARLKHVQDRTREINPSVTGAAVEATPSRAATTESPEPARAAADAEPAGARPVEGEGAAAATDAADTPGARPAEGEGAARDAADAPVTRRDGQTPQAAPDKKSMLGRAIRWAFPIATTGLGFGVYMNSGGGGAGPIDIPPPPVGGEGGGGGRGGPPVAFPVGAAAAAALDEEAAIQRALDRIRGSRAAGGSSPPFQTLQNYNMWR